MRKFLFMLLTLLWAIPFPAALKCIWQPKSVIGYDCWQGTDGLPETRYKAWFCNGCCDAADPSALLACSAGSEAGVGLNADQEHAPEQSSCG